MRLRRRFTFLVASLLGAAVVVLPAVAGSETAPSSVTAVNSEGPYKGHYWSPSTVTVGSGGGVVTFSNPSSEVSHGLEWTGGPAAPACSGVPGAPGTTSWHGECAFAQAGTYSFRCTVHPAEMTGTVTVSPTGTTTTTTTSTQPAAPGAPAPSIVGEPGSGGAGAIGSPLAGSAATAVKLASRQRGERVRGSVLVSQAGAGGRLEVDLLANSASLAIARHSRRARVGRIARSSLRPGRVSFTVALDARARRALHAHRRLALLVEVRLTPAHGSAVTIARSVLLHA